MTVVAAPTSATFDARTFAAAVARADWGAAEATLAAFADRPEPDWQSGVCPGLAPLATQALVQQGLRAVSAGAWCSAEAMFLVLEGRFPAEAEPALNLARVRVQRGQWASAWAALARVMANPGAPADAWRLALRVAPAAGQSAADRAALAESLLARAPEDAEAWFALATARLETGDYGAVHAALDACLARRPDDLPALWMRLTTPPRRNTRSEADQQQFLATWRETMARIAALPIESTALQASCRHVMSAQPNFYLAYLGLPCRDEARTFGDVLARIARAATGITADTRRPIVRARRRIGVVSRYFHEHSVSKLFLPLFLGLDRAQFEVIGFCPSNADDAWVARARSGFDGWVGGEGDGPAWAERIRAAGCDILVYPDLGMNAITHALAALRLAPVQAMMWGHPFSSGLPTIDAFLSSALMEPEDGDSHYVEPLVRLPGLGCGFQPPVFGASEFRLARTPGRTIALCGQMWAKLGPRHDGVFARLLAAAPMLDLHLSPAVDGEGLALLKERLASACHSAGVDFAARVVIHPRLAPADYHALQRQADFLLDSLGWSGGVTAFEAFAQDKPVVTLPGPVMRARHTAAMLRLMKLDGLVARDDDDYVAIAARLAAEPASRDGVSAAVRARKARLFDHSETQAAFAAWLLRQ